MKWFIPMFAALATLMFTSDAIAQHRTGYYAPAPVAAAQPVYAAPVTTYYAPPATVTYQPASAVYRPVAPAPVVYGRPVRTFYSPYGGTEVRVPGQPIRNTLRAIVP